MLYNKFTVINILKKKNIKNVRAANSSGLDVHYLHPNVNCARSSAAIDNFTNWYYR